MAKKSRIEKLEDEIEKIRDTELEEEGLDYLKDEMEEAGDLYEEALEKLATITEERDTLEDLSEDALELAKKYQKRSSELQSIIKKYLDRVEEVGSPKAYGSQ